MFSLPPNINMTDLSHRDRLHFERRDHVAGAREWISGY